jgi:arsenate reductase (glutaredoxin)
MSVTIYHNPDCGTSRNTLAMIRQSGTEPDIVEYLKNPPSRARLMELIKAMEIPVRALLREKGTPYAELGLANGQTINCSISCSRARSLSTDRSW